MVGQDEEAANKEVKPDFSEVLFQWMKASPEEWEKISQTLAPETKTMVAAIAFL